MGIYFGKNMVEGNLSTYFSKPMGMSPETKHYKAVQYTRIACACIGLGLVVEGACLLFTAISCGARSIGNKEEPKQQEPTSKVDENYPSFEVNQDVTIEENQVEFFSKLKIGSIIKIKGISYEVTYCLSLLLEGKQYRLSEKCDVMRITLDNQSKFLNLKKCSFVHL